MRTQRIFQPARRFTPSIVCSLPYSVLVILAELDRVALAHKAFTEDALGLIVRSSEGILRAAKNLCVASLLEAVRDHVKTVGLKQVNRVLLQPHWRQEHVVN